MKSMPISYILGAWVESRFMSVHIEQLGPHWNDFHEILYLKIFKKCAAKIQLPLKSDENKTGCWRPVYIYGNISAELFFKTGNVFHKNCREKNSFMFNNILTHSLPAI